MHLSLTDIIRAKWTNEIHDEWINSVLKDRKDLTKDQLYRTRDLMNQNVRDCIVENYSHYIPTIDLPDPNDKHVVAAAIHSSASVIVTYNIKDFPSATLQKFDIEAQQHPDEFISDLFDLDSALVCRAAKCQRLTLKNPPLDVDQYLKNLESQLLLNTANNLRKFSYLI